MTLNNSLFSNIADYPALTELNQTHYSLVAPWFAAIDGADIQLDAIRKNGFGAVYTDNAENPRAAFMLGDECFGYFAGDADAAGFVEDAITFLIERVMPTRPDGDRQVILFSADERWKAVLDQALAPRGGFRIRRHTFAFSAAAYEAARAELPPLPEGYALRGLESGGFDMGVFLGDEEAARCYEGFSGADKVEIGVLTAEAHRRRGLALHACAAFMDKCVAAGVEPHWSCWDYNTTSLNLALRLGFRRLPDMEVNFCE